ncbi:rho-related GTP-binding protein RhoA-B-like [Engraulis encrasicolus]|uniref:rho-related GTP-binding protein RhoA-B-like n=1 Tax=Engraulis encrasicolus TaxID=184585 RepID=UPI002FD2D89A
MAAVRKKVVAVGDHTSEKTKLMSTFTEGKVLEVYVPPVIDTFPITDVKVDNQEVELALYDTASREDCDGLRPLSYPDTDVILICFAVDSPDCFEQVPDRWVPEVKHFCPNVPIILVATKIDLRNDENVVKELSKMRQEPVKTEDGRPMAQRIGASAYMECSFESIEGINNVFYAAARAAVQRQNRRTSWINCCLLL